VDRDVTLRSGAAKLMPEPACRVARRSVPQFTSPKSRKVDELTPNAASPVMVQPRRSRAPMRGSNGTGVLPAWVGERQRGQRQPQAYRAWKVGVGYRKVRISERQVNI